MSTAVDWIEILRRQTQWDADSLGAQTTRDGVAVLERVVKLAQSVVDVDPVEMRSPQVRALALALKGEAS
jgi:hypothetical protein